jgi:chemotaxis protein methyltransferase CheR
MLVQDISNKEFSRIQSLMYRESGIFFSENKKALIVGRLSKRLGIYQYSSFTRYLDFIESGDASEELQTAIDLLTTNETYFFREPKHFDFLQDYASTLCLNGTTLRIWSAACSSGQEPYSIAMVLNNILGNRPWEIIATDISTQVLHKASKGIYSTDQASGIPRDFLKGIAEQSGNIMIDRRLRERIKFSKANLLHNNSGLGYFDIIFLRNVMIYFDLGTKQKVVQSLINRLNPGGYLLIGHSESLSGVNSSMEMLAPAIFRKPAQKMYAEI